MQSEADDLGGGVLPRRLGLRPVRERRGVAELRDALTQISEIRRQVVADGNLPRVPRDADGLLGAPGAVPRPSSLASNAMPMAFSGLPALGAAGYQAVWIPDPAEHLTVYLAL